MYPDAELTGKYLQNLQEGDKVKIRGPKGVMHYRKGMVKKIGMVASGTGVTPMYQLIGAICEDPTHSTHATILHGKKTESDILLRNKLGKFAAKYPENFEGHYVLSDAPESWQGRKGYVTKELVEEKFPQPWQESKALLYKPPGLVKAMRRVW